MKPKFTILPLHKILILFLLTSNLLAQEDKNSKDLLASMDTTVIKGKAFLNKGIIIKGLLDGIKDQKQKNENGKDIITLTPKHFEMLSTLIADADLGNSPKNKEISFYQDRKRQEITSSNIIPIGVINSEAVFLSEVQINDNIKAKSDKKKPDNKDYEYFDIIAAGLLQGEIFQADINFRISPNLLQTNSKNDIKGIEIDFQDGSGFKSYKWIEQLIPFTFKQIGKVSIAIKLLTKKGDYITYNVLDVKQLKRPIPYIESTKVNVAKEITDANARLQFNVTGGEYAIFTGCDGIFDKPIIIAEGFDVGQDVGIDDMVAKYFHYLYTFRNNGFDLVFVNYNDGRDYMQNNANVLMEVIRQVNIKKSGTYKNVVVGESMSGLIARFALCKMESQGEQHQVSHFVAFDSPMQGANVPIGLVTLRHDLVNQAGYVLTALGNLLSPELRAINTPAAKQLLLVSTSSLTQDPLFGQFRQLLSAFGNNGYPQQGGIRNIALINGALDGRRNFSNRNDVLYPGEQLLDFSATLLLCNTFLNVWSNQLLIESKVYRGFTHGICSFGYGNTEKKANSYVNYDRLPGGFSEGGSDDNWLIQTPIEPKFSFVPTFSAIDYKGALVTDADFTFSINNNIINGNTYQVINTNLTPFKAIYGNDANNTHSFSRDEQFAWNNLATRENFGILNSTSVLPTCNLPAPQLVKELYFSRNQGPRVRSLPSGACVYTKKWYQINKPNNKILLAMDDFSVSDNYVQFIRITGPNSINITLRNFYPNTTIPNPESTNKVHLFDYSNLAAGTYNIAVVRQFYNSTTTEAITNTTFTISRGCRVGVVDCPEDTNDGTELGFLTSLNKTCYSVKSNGIWCAVLEDGTFISRSILLANDFPLEATNCFAENDPFGTANCPTDGTVVGSWNPGTVQLNLKVREFNGKKFLTQVVTDRTTPEFVTANDIFQVRGKDFLNFAPNINVTYPLTTAQLVNYCLSGEPTGFDIPLSFTVPSGYKAITVANDIWGDVFIRDNNGTNTSTTSAYLSDNNWVSATAGYGTVQKDKSTSNNTIKIGNVLYQKGLGTHAGNVVGDNAIIYNLNNIPGGPWTSFEAILGRDDVGDACGVNVQFQVFVDDGTNNGTFTNMGNYLMDFSQPGLPISINITGKSILKLVVNSGTDGNYYCDHADWADAKVTKNGTTPVPVSLCISNVNISPNVINGQNAASWNISASGPPYYYKAYAAANYTLNNTGGANVLLGDWYNNAGTVVGINAGNSFYLELTDVNNKKGVVFLNSNGTSNVLTGCGSARIGIKETLESDLTENPSSLKIFPNPTENILNIVSEFKIESVSIVSSSGKIVMERNFNGNSFKENLNIKDLPSATYIVQVKSKNKQEFKQIIKQ